MAPLMSATGNGIESGQTTALILGVLASVATVISMVLVVVACGCCDDDPNKHQPMKVVDAQKSQRSQKDGSGKKGPPKPVDVKALAKQFKVSETEMQALVDRFKAMDVNNDGSLTDVELVEAMSKLDQPISREQAIKFIKQYDKNGDGNMQLEEFLTMVCRRKKWSKPDAEKAALEAFKSFDKDGDGHISAEELKKAMNDMGDPIKTDEAEEMIKMADKDKDGNISYEEFVHFWLKYTQGG